MKQMGCIAVVTVNHNTSRCMELMLGSLHAMHAPSLPLSLTPYDNASDDDTTALEAFVKSKGIPMQPSGFTTRTVNNSRGEILRRFVLEHPRCAYYVFLDADVCLVQQDTIGTMMRELAEDRTAFGIGPQLSWDGQDKLPADVPKKNPDIYLERPHPRCALVRNTECFRNVLQEVGLSCVEYLWAEKRQHLDTFRLMTNVMRTHGYHHLISSTIVIHFFCVSYDREPKQVMQEKSQRRDVLLKMHRQMRSGRPRTVPQTGPKECVQREDSICDS